MKSAGRKTLNSAAASKHRCPVSLQAVSFGNVAPASSSSTADCCALNGADNLQVAKTDPRDQILRRKPAKQIPEKPAQNPMRPATQPTAQPEAQTATQPQPQPTASMASNLPTGASLRSLLTRACPGLERARNRLKCLRIFLHNKVCRGGVTRCCHSSSHIRSTLQALPSRTAKLF